MKNFLITSTGRTGTYFLAQVMNRSKKWTVQHQPDDKDAVREDKVKSIKEFYDPVPEYQQKRFNRDYYGEVNGLLRYNLYSLNVNKKGIIYRNYKDVILSFANGRDGRHTIEGLITKIYDVNVCHNAFYQFIKNDPEILLIDFEKMTSSSYYLEILLEYFGIFDVGITKAIIDKKINPNTKWKYKSYNDFPEKIKKLIENLKWENYN